ncbi:MAG: hypothetical protein J7641_07220 [Cyanobacteria bacterium SID2]|nr:hypothetical protein [Cyanobacteria bacterium SID2]MBP0005543.1 hypothetical protein [Cyanobacteria bacterium SBC]
MEAIHAGRSEYAGTSIVGCLLSSIEEGVLVEPYFKRPTASCLHSEQYRETSRS